MGGGFHEREAEFGVVLSTTKLLGEPDGAVKQKPQNDSNTVIQNSNRSS